MINDWNIYYITDSSLSRNTLLYDLESALKAGIKVVQLREKELGFEELIILGESVKFLCNKYNADFIVNDSIKLALELDADGVHLGQQDKGLGIAKKLLGEKLLGITVHNIEEAKQAEQLGADYLGVSPIFNTKTKKDAGEGKGLELIKEIRKITDLHITAIGGIKISNIKSVLESGANSIAMISELIDCEDVEAKVKQAIGVFND